MVSLGSKLRGGSTQRKRERGKIYIFLFIAKLDTTNNYNTWEFGIRNYFSRESQLSYDSVINFIGT